MIHYAIHQFHLSAKISLPVNELWCFNESHPVVLFLLVWFHDKFYSAWILFTQEFEIEFY